MGEEPLQHINKVGLILTGWYRVGLRTFLRTRKFDNICFDPKFYFKVCIPDESSRDPESTSLAGKKKES